MQLCNFKGKSICNVLKVPQASLLSLYIKKWAAKQTETILATERKCRMLTTEQINSKIFTVVILVGWHYG